MKKNSSQIILVISVLVLFIALLWVYLSIYRVFHKKPDANITSINVTTLDPNLDSKILEDLSQRKY